MTAEDERAISAVLLRYATGIDRRDWRLFRTCFAEDFEGDYPGFGLWRGPDEIARFMEEAHAPLGPTLHRMTNFVIDGQGGSGTARSYVDVMLMPATPDGDVHRAAGYYDDQFVRTSDGWKIRRREFVPVQIV
jgi:3-phenylpropionate/cinnamic acid dioxygenase small subunit